MNWLAPKLHLRLAQKQILTPGLVQMVSVPALNRLELREMINQEIMANPVSKNSAEDGVTGIVIPMRPSSKRNGKGSRDRGLPIPFDEFDFGSFFTQYLDTGAERSAGGEHEEIERPSFDKFLSSPASLTDHLDMANERQHLHRDRTSRSPRLIIGNLDENGYLTATLDEICAAWKLFRWRMSRKLSRSPGIDFPGVGARNL